MSIGHGALTYHSFTDHLQQLLGVFLSTSRIFLTGEHSRDFDPPLLLREGHNIGNAYYMKGDLEKSISSYILALKLNPDSPECHYNLATAYNDHGNYTEARSHFETSL
jgi:tetratricopeptide (TPR) repeat protein